MPPRSSAKIEALETVLRALADQTRLRILALLVGSEVCVCHLHESLRLPQPTVSRHLAYLRRAGLVAARKDGLWVHYRVTAPTDEVLSTVVRTVTHCTSHITMVQHDRGRLERLTGCCAPDPGDDATDLACCAS